MIKEKADRVDADVQKPEPLVHRWRECEMVQPLRKTERHSPKAITDGYYHMIQQFHFREYTQKN